MDRNRKQNEQFSKNVLIDLGIANLSRLWAYLIIDQLIKNEICDFFISPGLRNTPLIHAINKIPNSNFTVGIDERSLAYMALGNSKVKNKPSVLVCTSGTALANFYPAIIEATKSKTPLLILSADRPFEKNFSGDNQTINQENIYANFVQKSLNLPEPTEKIMPLELQKIISQTINPFNEKTSIIHINLPFREPFDTLEEDISENYVNSSLKSLEINEEALKIYSKNSVIKQETIDFVSNNRFDLLTFGKFDLFNDCNHIKNILNHFSGYIYLDITSSLRHFIPKDKQVYSEKQLLEIVSQKTKINILHIGNKLTSKNYYESLYKNLENISHIAVSTDKNFPDPSFSLNTKIDFEPSLFLKKIVKLEGINKAEVTVPPNVTANEYTSIWKNLTEIITDVIPNNHNLFLSNSSTIRMFNEYSFSKSSKQINIFSNRGASGIEGIISSAIGVAKGSNAAVTCIIGDISFFHDLNSLMALDKSTPPISIIVVNDYGGGIFKGLPISNDLETLNIISTNHDFTFDKISEAFKIDYIKTINSDDIIKGIKNSIDENRHVIIEVELKNKE